MIVNVSMTLFGMFAPMYQELAWPYLGVPTFRFSEKKLQHYGSELTTHVGPLQNAVGACGPYGKDVFGKPAVITTS